MKRHLALLLATPLALLLAGALASAQSNTDGQIDIQLANLDDLQAVGRLGAFPNGSNGCVLLTTACNVGSKVISWKQPMQADHPFIAFLAVRELDGRFEQISDRSYVKHGFFALNSNFCGPCTSLGDSTQLQVGCSDTYSVNSNGNRFYLGPPAEVDPWLGIWDPVCSYFDRGDPPASPPQDCNGLRSLTQAQVDAMNAVQHRMVISDADLNQSAGTFWFQAQYVLKTEGEGVRGNNIASREFRPAWTGAAWNLVERGTLSYGTVLQRWSGATVTSATNGGDDGRLYVAVKVTGPDALTGFYHYEYAVHDRDNARGVASLHVPTCTGARVRSAGFRDIDANAGNDWSIGVGSGELVFSGPSNPLAWNTIYNFWFDSDAAPAAGALVLDQAAPGPGLASVVVGSSAPLELFNVALGPGCAQGTPPTLFAVGTPPRATLGNATFALRSTGNAALQPSWLRYSAVPGSYSIGACTRYLGPGPGFSFPGGMAVTDGSGSVDHPAPVPNDIALEGLSLNLQAAARNPGHGVIPGGLELSDGLRVRIGSAVTSCP